MRSRDTLLLLPLALLAGCADPAPSPTPRPSPAPDAPYSAAAVASAVATITAADIYSRVSLLSADSMMGRDTPSPGLEMAAAYIVREHTRLGLEPAGEGGTFYQRYPLRSFALDTVGTHFGTVLANNSGNEMLALGTDFFALSGTSAPAGDMNHAKLVYVGALGSAGLPKADYRGTAPVVLIPGGYSAEWRASVTAARNAAREAGATAVVVVMDETFPGSTFRQLAQAARATRETVDTATANLSVFYLTHAAFTRVADRAKNRAALKGSGSAVPVDGIQAHFAATSRILQNGRPPNVVAVLRGSDPVLRDEYVVLSAHMDHVGVGAPVNGDSIYNGADDDASGTSGLLEVAEAFASLPVRPRRSIIFLHVSGEEKGLLGSQYYSNNPTVPLSQIVANVNVDMIGRNSPDTVVVIGKNYSTLGRTADEVQARHPELGLALSDDLWPEERFFFRSDHYNFARKEIPSIFFFSGVHPDYHAPSDEVDKLDVDKASRIARTIFYTVESVANETARPRWDPRGLSEVRALTR